MRRCDIPIDPEELLYRKDENEAGERRVCVPELYVRSGPGTEYAIVDSLRQGDRVSGDVTQETVWLKIGAGRWIAVRYQGKDFCEYAQ